MSRSDSLVEFETHLHKAEQAQSDLEGERTRELILYPSLMDTSTACVREDSHLYCSIKCIWVLQHQHQSLQTHTEQLSLVILMPLAIKSIL